MTQVIEYDPATGEKTRQLDKQNDGTWREYTNYDVYVDGTPLSSRVIYRDADFKITSYTDYEFGEGYITKETKYDSNNKVVEYREYEYAEKQCKITIKDKDGNIKYICVETYEDAEREKLVSTEWKDKDGNVIENPYAS